MAEPGAEGCAASRSALRFPTVRCSYEHLSLIHIYGACQALAIAHDEVAGVLVLAVVVSTGVVKLLRREGHEDGDLRGGDVYKRQV